MRSLTQFFGVMSCAFLLGLGLSGSPASAARDATSTDRIGGQAGMEGKQGRMEGLTTPSNGRRIGGQAGLKGEKERLEGLAAPSNGMRIGGQAGLKGEKERLEGITDTSTADHRKG